MAEKASTTLMKAVMRDLNERALDGWHVRVTIDRESDNVWLYLTEPCYAVSAGRWLLTRMYEDARLPDAAIHATVDDLIAQLTNPAFVRAKFANESVYVFEAYDRWREARTPADQQFGERIREIKRKRDGSRWGEW